MSHFYSFYTKNLGNVSNKAFQLFWNGDYKRCFQLYRQVIADLGSVVDLGMNDMLIYHHCAMQSGIYALQSSCIPSPPSESDILCLSSYELSQERLRINEGTGKFLAQPSILSKAILAACIGIQNGCKQAIETGTFLGASSYLFSGVYETVDTIEADSRLHASSMAWLTATRSNITCHLGNSADILSRIMEGRAKKQLIFLDAHYSTGITSKEYGICPLLRELDYIFRSSIDCVIVVDDLRCMDSPGYPTLREILEVIPQGKNVTMHHDQLIVI